MHIYTQAHLLSHKHTYAHTCKRTHMIDTISEALPLLYGFKNNTPKHYLCGKIPGHNLIP